MCKLTSCWLVCFFWRIYLEQSERREGNTYKSGIGVTSEGQAITKGIINGVLDGITDEEMRDITLDVQEIQTAEVPAKDDV